MRFLNKMKKMLLTLIASMWAVMFASASTVDDLTAITATCVYAFDDYTGNGTGTRSVGSLFGGNHFLDVNGGSVSTSKKTIDIADLTTYAAINGADTVSLAAKYTTYGSHLNSLRLKNAQDVIALKPIAGSVIYLFGNGNNKEGTTARIPKFATDASLEDVLNEAPDASHPVSGTYVYKFEVPKGFNGKTPLYIGSYNGDAFFSFIVVEVPSDDIPLDPDIDVPAAPNYGAWDFTNFSEETLAGLQNDYINGGCWSQTGDTRYTLQCEKKSLTYKGLNGTDEVVKETKGLLFSGGGSGALYFDYGETKSCIKFNKTNLAVTIPRLSNGTIITIVTKTGNSSSERGIICTSNNALRVSGELLSLEENVNVFMVISDEGETADVTFQPYVGGINIYSIVCSANDGDTVSAMEQLEEIRYQVLDYATQLELEGWRNLGQSLSDSYESTYIIDANSVAAVLQEIDRLSYLLIQYKKIYESVTNKPISSFDFGTTVSIDDWSIGIDKNNYVACVNAYYGEDSDVVVPESFTYDDQKYFTVGLGVMDSPCGDYMTWDYYSDIESVKLPTTLRFLGAYAFSHCYNLKGIELPESLTAIGEYAFRGCQALDGLVIPSKVTSVGGYFLSGCKMRSLRSEAVSAPLADDFSDSNLRVIYVPSGSGASYRDAAYWQNYLIVDGEGISVTVNVKVPGTFGEQVLAQVENLDDANNLKVSGSLNDDDLYCIQNRMPNLLTIDMSGMDMTALPDGMFSQRDILQKVVLPERLKSIGDDAFYMCYSLQDIEFPTTLSSIGINAFYDCDNIKNVIIPEGVTFIGSGAFSNCGKLNTVKLPAALKTINQSMFSYSALTSVIMPEGLQTIGAYAFSNCDYLSSVSLNEGLTAIEHYAFHNCDALKKITLPNTLMSCNVSFEYCDNLKEVTCLALLPPSLTDNAYPVYSNSNGNCTLYVPEWCINKYKLTKGWDQFTSIKPLDGYWPENITVQESVTLSVPETLPDDYKPNLRFDYKKTRDSWGIEFPSYGSLSLSGENTLSIGEYRMCYDVYNEDYYKRYGYYDYGAYGPYSNALVNNGIMRADSVAIRISLPNDRWTFLSFPFDVKVSDIEATDVNTNYVIRKYSGADRAAMTGNTWQNMTVDSILHAGEGYIWQCSRSEDYYCNFVVSAMNNVNKNLIFTNETRTIALNEYQAEFSHNRSWNLIGNPFPCYYDTRAMDFTAPITVWDILNNTYVAYSPIDDEYILRPGEAFFVQCPVDVRNINFSVDGRQTDLTVKERVVSSGARSVSVPRQVFNIYLSNGSLSDHTRFVINAKAEMNYNMSHDAGKFMSSDAMTPQLFTIENGVHYAINERPMGNGVIALGTYFGSEGTYTLALDTEVQTEIILVDKLTGKEVNLAAADYTFFTEAGTVTDRFEIKFGGATSVEGNVVQQVSVQAVGGQIVVNGAEDVEAVVYTTDGKQIATVKGNAALEVAPGLYIVNVQGKSYKVSVVR